MLRQSVLIFLALFLCGVSAIQPGCRSRYEVRMKWAVKDNAASFWQCSRWGNAVRVACPTGTLFSAPFQTCVPEKFWEQFPYYAPPTTVNDYADECTEDVDQCFDPCLEVECNGGQVIDNKCVCYGDAVLVDGTCIATPGEIDGCENGEWNAVEERCVCNEGFEMVEGACVPKTGCENGQVNAAGECICDEGYQMLNGWCIATPGEIDGCENGQVNAAGECICDEGYQMLNGWCFPTSGMCPGAGEEAYVRGTMDCEAPVCNAVDYWPNVHLPTRNPLTYWQCANQDNVIEKPCSAGTCFSAEKKVCVHPWQWVNPCN